MCVCVLEEQQLIPIVITAGSYLLGDYKPSPRFYTEMTVLLNVDGQSQLSWVAFMLKDFKPVLLQLRFFNRGQNH